MSRQTTDQLYIDLDYYSPEDYYVYTAEASVVLEGYIQDDYFLADYFQTNGSVATLTADLTEVVGEVKEFDAAFSSAFSQTATGTKILDLTTADIEGGSGLAAAFTNFGLVTMNGVKTAGFDATMASAFTQSVTPRRLAGLSSTLASNFTVSATPSVTRGFGSGLNASASITCVNFRVRPFESDFDTAFTASIDADLTARGLFQADAAFTQSVTAVKTTDTDSTQSAQFTQTVTGTRIQPGSASLSTAFSQTASGARTARVTEQYDSQFTQSASGDRFRGFDATLNSAFTLSATGEDFDFASATLSSQFTQSVSAIITADADSTLNSVASISATPSVTAATWNPKSWIIGVEGDTSNDFRPQATLINNGTIYEVHNRTINDSVANADGFAIVSRDAEDGSVNWDMVYNGPTDSAVVPRLFLDGDELVVAVYSNQPAQSYRGSILRIDSSNGTINSNTSNNTGQIQDYAVDSSGNVYTLALAFYNNGTNTGQTAVVKKFNSSGTQQWAKNVTRVGSAIYFPQSLVLAHSAVFVSFYEGLSGDTFVMKLATTDGSISAQKETNAQFRKMFTDSSGNLYATGPESGGTYIKIAKLDSSLTADWTWRTATEARTGSQEVNAFVADSDGDYYIAMNQDYFGHNIGALRVSESSGTPTIEWQSLLEENTTPTVTEADYWGVVTDESHMYITGYTESSSNAPMTFTNKVRKSDGAAYWSEIDFTTDTSNTGDWTYKTSSDISLSTGTSPIDSTSSLSVGTWTGSGNTAAVFTTTDTIDHYQWVYGVFGFALNGAEFGISVTGTRVFSLTKTLDSSTTLTAAPTSQLAGSATLSASATMTVTGSRTRTLDATQLDSQTTLSADGVRLLDAIVNLSSAFTQTVDGARTRDFDATFDSSATLSGLVGVIKPLSATLGTAFTATLTADITARGDFQADARFTISTDAVKTTDITEQYDTETTLSVDTLKIVGFEASLSTAFTQTATAEVIRAVGADFSSAFTQTATTTDSRIARITETLASEATLTADNLRLRFFDSALDTETTLSIEPSKIVGADSTLNSEFTATFIAGVRVDLTLELTGFFTKLSAGKVINFDPFRTLTVYQENRLVQVLPENRTITVDQETRVNTLI